jgi:hypothetical protein
MKAGRLDFRLEKNPGVSPLQCISTEKRFAWVSQAG